MASRRPSLGLATLHLLTLTPEAHAALRNPTTALHRATVVWLLLAPVVAAPLSVYAPSWLLTFDAATSLFGVYYAYKISGMYPSENILHQGSEDIKPIAKDMCDGDHYLMY